MIARGFENPYYIGVRQEPFLKRRTTTVRLEQTPDYARNARKCGDDFPCARCGRPIKNKDRATWVRLDIHNNIRGDEETVNPAHDLGGFPIGPECKKVLGL
jgi:hypothetical protein